MRFTRLLKPDKDIVNAARRALYQRIDQIYAPLKKQLLPPCKIANFQGPTRFSLLTVNFSTTYYLKLMLLTLCEQKNLAALRRVVIVDNNSKDGGGDFLEQLASRTRHIHLYKNKFNCTHASGLRKGIDYIDKIEQHSDQQQCSNALLICDTDIIFLNPQTLNDIGSVLAKGNTAFAGELRQGLYPYPEAQASFFAMRRDCYARPDVTPIVHHGAPAYFMQRSLWKAGLKLAHFPSNHGGYILHRGRSGVLAASTYHRFSSFGTVENNVPHFMGIKDGKKIWANIEERYKHLLQTSDEQALLLHLSEHLGRLGSQ